MSYVLDHNTVPTAMNANWKYDSICHTGNAIEMSGCTPKFQLHFIPSLCQGKIKDRVHQNNASREIVS